MSMIDTDTIKSLNDCRAIAERYLGQPAGKTAQTVIYHCPFHAEKTPGGFHVYKDGYKCFSCGVNGDVIGLVMALDDVDFMGAITALGGGQPVTPERQVQIAREAAERTARELEEKIRQAQKALEDLRKAQTWERYHDEMSDRARQMWNARGINDGFIDLWQLGFSEDYTLWRKDGSQWVDWWHSPTLTIPIWGDGWQVNNVKHRLINAPPDGGKYHQEKRNVPAAPFVCNPDVTKGPLFLAEGEIKSMVVYQTLDDPRVQVEGLPAARPDDSMWAKFANYEPVYLCLDPDAKIRPASPDGKPRLSAVENAIHKIGRERVRMVDLPDKIDDMINGQGLDKSWMKMVLRQARRV
jgi:hypothetical protein